MLRKGYLEHLPGGIGSPAAGAKWAVKLAGSPESATPPLLHDKEKKIGTLELEKKHMEAN